MKIHYLLMLQFILSLFGCKKAPGNSTTTEMMGPFTIETISSTGKGFNMNSGSYRYTRVSYAVKYKGEALRFSNKLETNTTLPGIWRVFYIENGPTPALLLGSQSLYLVTVENDQPVIKPLFEQGTDFASIQWLDSEAGQPGEYREIYNSDELDTETTLSGGRYLAITHAVVFDTKTFELLPFNLNNDPIDGYSISSMNAVAFSPDSTQVIYRGYKQDEANWEVSHHSLLSYNIRTGATYAVPYDKKTFRLKDEFKLTTGWVQDYFEWIPTDDGSLRLQPKKLDKLPYQKGILLYQRYRGYIYTLDPVAETMVQHLADYIISELKIDPAQVTRGEKSEYSSRFQVNFNAMNLKMVYGEYGYDIVLSQEGESQSVENKNLITLIATGFNTILNDGRYEDQWLEIVPAQY